MGETEKIPENILREHILKVIEYIDENGVPKKRQSTKYDLLYKAKRYPPKYIISIANKYSNGKEFGSQVFYGGKQSNDFLNKRGFDIVDK